MYIEHVSRRFNYNLTKTSKIVKCKLLLVVLYIHCMSFRTDVQTSIYMQTQRTMSLTLKNNKLNAKK